MIINQTSFDKGGLGVMGIGWTAPDHFGILADMRHVPKILLTGLFAIVVFVPRETLGLWVYWSLFLCMFLLLLVHYLVSYWVSASWTASNCPCNIQFSFFCAKIPPLTGEDLVRGRLVICDSTLLLYSKPIANANLVPRQVWTAPLDTLSGFGFRKVSGNRSGLVLFFKDGGDARFSVWLDGRTKDSLRGLLSPSIPELEVVG